MNRSLDIQNIENVTIYEGQTLEVSGEAFTRLKEGLSNLSKRLQELNADSFKIVIHNTYPNIRLSYAVIFYKGSTEVESQNLTDELFLRYLSRSSKIVQDVSPKIENAPKQTYSFLNLEKKAGESFSLKMTDDFVKDFFKEETAQIMQGKNWSLKITPKIQGCFIQSLLTQVEKTDGSLVTQHDFWGDNSNQPHELILSIQEHYEFLRTLEKYALRYNLIAN